MVNNVLSHLGRLQKETLHLKEVIGPHMWDNCNQLHYSLSCSVIEGKFLKQSNYRF